MSVQTTCRVPRPRCTKCTKTSLKFSAMQLSLQEPKRCYGLQGTSIQGLRHNKTKRWEETQDSPSFDPLAIATTGNGEVESKEQQTPNKPRAQSTSYWIDGDWEQERKKKEWNPHSSDQLVMERTKVGWKVMKTHLRCQNKFPDLHDAKQSE
jgi:hypothetical protein